MPSYSYDPFQLNKQIKLKTHVKILFRLNITSLYNLLFQLDYD